MSDGSSSEGSSNGQSANGKPGRGIPLEVPLEVVDSLPEENAASGFRSAPVQGRGPSLFGRAVRFAVSVAVAALADGLEVAFPAAWLVIDLAAAGVFLLLWGVRWEVAMVLVPELIPGVAAFPSWTLLALFLGTQRQGKG